MLSLQHHLQRCSVCDHVKMCWFGLGKWFWLGIIAHKTLVKGAATIYHGCCSCTLNNFGAISFLVLNDPFEEGVGEKTWEKKSRAWCCFCLLESGQKRLLPILTLGFLLGEILPKVGIFFSLFFLFFFC